MITNLVAIIAVLLIFATVVTYHYLMDLRRDRTAAREQRDTAWRLYEASNRELCAMKGIATPDPYLPEDQQRKPTSSAFIPTGIGPTAINDRELRREMQERADRTEEPPFASPHTLNPELPRRPTPEAIRAAAREALYPDGDPRT